MYSLSCAQSLTLYTRSFQLPTSKSPPLTNLTLTTPCSTARDVPSLSLVSQSMFHGFSTLNQRHHRFPPTQHLSSLHTQNHPRHQDAVVIEEVRFSRTSQATHPSAETAHAALNRIGGSHHQVVVPPRVHEKSLSPLDALRFALLSYQSLDCDAKSLVSVILFTYSCFLNKHQRNHTRMTQYPRRP